MTTESLLQHTIERFWDTVPPVWGHVRGNARTTAVQDFKITLEQFHILRHIRRGAHSAADLAQRQLISRPAITQAVDLLVEKGLVTRQQDRQDRRYIQLELTKSGNALLDSVFTKNRRWMAGKMATLSPTELKTILHALDILKTTFDPTTE
jgi:DNA-binding MarR family transcriptional regulator